MALAIDVKDVHMSYRTINPVSVKGLSRAEGKRSSRYEALRGISFQVERGEILGVVGSNGSGKSTLLRTIAGIFSPDQGSIETFGNSVSLLAIGVGFQPRLSGRDNIVLAGLLLGFSLEEIQKRMDSIIQFSELGEFIEKPVKTYSSGMYSKLAFAITVILETDIILIDEVLSVGDARFNKKSFAKMKELISGDDRTVIIVSHAMATIRELCSRVMWMEKGTVRMLGETKEVLEAYSRQMG